MSARQGIARSIAYLLGRKRDYQAWFGSPAGQRVLGDLAEFCRARQTCGVPGNRDLTMILIGRNEVWQRIEQHLRLEPEQLYALYDAAAAARHVSGDADDE